MVGSYYSTYIHVVTTCTTLAVNIQLQISRFGLHVKVKDVKQIKSLIHKVVNIHYISETLSTYVPHVRRYSRFEIGIKQDVIAVHLKAVLVIDDDLLHALQRLDDDVVDPLERFLDLQWRHPSILFYHIVKP